MTSQQKREPRDDALGRLFAAAVDLFAERGYSGTTVDAIVERAGVAKGTVYYHFKGKAELLDALLLDGLERLAECLRAVDEGAQTPQEALRALIHAEITYIQQHQSFSRFVMSQIWRTDAGRERQSELLRLLLNNHASVFGAVLARGIEAGVFRPTIDPRDVSFTLFGMIATATLNWRFFRPEVPLEEIERGVQELVFGAVERHD